MAESIQLPVCPSCGCKRSEIVEVRENFGMTSEGRRCGNPRCGKIYRHTPTYAYDSDPIRCVCPNCSTKNPEVTRTVSRKDDNGRASSTIRYHRCGACEYTFKTIEGGR